MARFTSDKETNVSLCDKLDDPLDHYHMRWFSTHVVYREPVTGRATNRNAIS